MVNKSPYKDQNGMRLPGVTTIIHQELGWNKGVLIDWANKRGLEGIETKAMVDDLAEIGTIAHQFVLDKIKKVETNTNAFSKDHIAKAMNCLDSYNNWMKDKTVEAILLEARLISEKLKFGGTPDFYGKINEKLTLQDYKTGKALYDEYLIQVAGGYLILLEEQGLKVERIELLNIPRSSGESFQVLTIPENKWGYCKKIFLNCLDNYKTKKLLTG